MNEHWIVIVNPKSGSAGEDFRERVESALQTRGANFDIRETTPEVGGDALAAQAVQEGATHFIACGGDGTVMSVVNGLGKESEDAPETMPTLAIIPGGTANLLATALRVPMDHEAAIGVALSGEDRDIDLGRCGKHLFALGLGLGLTERLVSRASTREKETLGRWAYARAMLRELGARPHTFSFILDDKPEQDSRGVAIVVANCGDIGSTLKFAPDAKMDDGLIDLCVLHRFMMRDVLRMIWRSLKGDLPEDRAVSFFQAKRVEIRSDPPLDLQIDGEEVDLETPLVAQVLPSALKVRVPVEETPEAQAVAEAVAAARKPFRLWAAGVGIAVAVVGALWWRKRK